MGNSPSKDGAPLSRTTSSASLRSNKSSRSTRSLRKQKNDSSSSLSKLGSSTNNSSSQPKSLSRKNLDLYGDSQGQKEKPFVPGEGDKELDDGIPNQFNNLNLSNNNNLPPSMMQIEPKQPILIRRNTNGSASGDVSGLNTPVADKDSPLLSPSYNENPTIMSSNNSSNNASNGVSLSRTSTNHSISLAGPGTGENNDELRSLSKSRSNSSFSSLRLLSKTNSNMLSRHSSNVTSSNFDIENLIQRLLDSGYSGKRSKNVCLKNNEIQMVCSRAREILLSQPSLLELNPPVKVVGDVHGQYGDLIRIFTKCGFPPQTNYLFLGDYVDRGKQSLETILLLLCYKIKYPENFFLLRGNHECANVTRVYGFYDECKRRCNIKTWKLFIDTFNTLPIAAIVAGKIFCVHGGLLPVLSSLDEIRNIARPTDVPDFGLLNDLLWSDPADTLNEWEDNERGVSYVFSKVAINKFLQKFGFDLVCRAHMVVEDGYEFFNDQTLVTVFSAPNYCGEFDNWGAVMSVSEELLCSFELLDPLDSVALKQVMKKGRQERKAAMIQ